MLQPAEKDVRLERVELARQRLHVSPRALQPRLALDRIELHIRIRTGRKLAQPDEDEDLLVAERRDELCEFIELLGQQRAVDVA